MSITHLPTQRKLCSHKQNLKTSVVDAIISAKSLNSNEENVPGHLNTSSKQSTIAWFRFAYYIFIFR